MFRCSWLAHSELLTLLNAAVCSSFCQPDAALQRGVVTHSLVPGYLCSLQKMKEEVFICVPSWGRFLRHVFLETFSSSYIIGQIKSHSHFKVVKKKMNNCVQLCGLFCESLTMDWLICHWCDIVCWCVPSSKCLIIWFQNFICKYIN